MLFMSPPLTPRGERLMTQSIQLTQPQSRQQIFEELGIKLRSPPTLMGNDMPVPAFLSCTRLILHPPSLSRGLRLTWRCQPRVLTYGCALAT